jgi:hypothetical protein
MVGGDTWRANSETGFKGRLFILRHLLPFCSSFSWVCMDKNLLPSPPSILWIVLAMIALIALPGCAAPATALAQLPTALSSESPVLPSTGDPTPTSGNESQEEQIENYIVQEVAGSETEHRYIVRVSANDLRAPLPTTSEAIQKCWLYQEGTLHDCLADDFLNSFGQEGTGAGGYSYIIFSIVKMDPESGKATVRVDEVAGPRASKGLLYTLIRVNDRWQTESSKLLWTG